MKTILVPTDFGEDSDRALDYAIELAREEGAAITLLHSYELPEVHSSAPPGIAAPDPATFIIADAKAAMEERSTEREIAGITLHSLLRNGEPSETIEAVARAIGADLIVMGTRGRHAQSRSALLGSVAATVVRSAVCPVLTIGGSSTRSVRAEAHRMHAQQGG